MYLHFVAYRIVNLAIKVAMETGITITDGGSLYDAI
jgi:hypothetical protein